MNKPNMMPALWALLIALFAGLVVIPWLIDETPREMICVIPEDAATPNDCL